MKQFPSWFTHGVPGGSTLRRSIFEAKQGEQVMDAVDRFFTTEAAYRIISESDLEPAAFAGCQGLATSLGAGPIEERPCLINAGRI